MMWHSILISVVIALVIATFLASLLGWRRPNARAEEDALYSALFLFAMLFLGVWAISLWVEPWGPLVWDVPWVMLALFGGIIALLILTAAPLQRRDSAELVAARQATSSEEVVEGFGAIFWVLVCLLLIVGVLGSVDYR